MIALTKGAEKILVDAKFQVFQQDTETFSTKMLEDSNDLVAIQISKLVDEEKYAVSADLNYSNVFNAKTSYFEINKVLLSIIDEFQKYDDEVRKSRKRFAKLEKTYE